MEMMHVEARTEPIAEGEGARIAPPAPAPIHPSSIRYIKLGEGGAWVDRSIEAGEMHFGFAMIDHAIASRGDWDAIARQFVSQGRAPRIARRFAREIEEFYTLGPDCLWITFARGHLWWAFAEPQVHWLGTGEGGQGARMRKVIGSWRKTSLAGEPLAMQSLSTRLSKLAAYRQTICSVQESDYLLRKINGKAEPILTRASEARAAMIAVASEAITALHWADFEILVDLIFARGGWQRASAVGGMQKDVDILLEQPTTKETAFVQVKSRASQRVLEDCLHEFEASGADRFFFVCHSPFGSLEVGERANVHVWTRAALAEAAIQAGLYDWLLRKVA